MIDPSKNPSKFVKCTCGCNMLEVERYEESYIHEGNKVIDRGWYFVIWGRFREGKKIWGLKERFRWCWNILKTGQPWADDIIATDKDARELAEFILKNIPNEEK
jgi:hypothetical protein